jgi:hypothetical protein
MISNEVAIGATEELRLRVSVAALVRVLFEHPRTGEWILALERKATLYETQTGRSVEIKSQPFGGAIRIYDLQTLRQHIGEFHFDSEESRSEQDFRIFIHPSAWETVKEFCLQHLRQPGNPILESDPTRELAEEFADTLGIQLKPDQYVHQPVGMVIENHPFPAKSLHARGAPTARLYRIFEARLLDPSLRQAMIDKSEIYTDQKLREIALEDFQNGGLGRANAVLTVPLSQISNAYESTALEARNSPISFQNDRLDETVAAVLEGITVPKYQRL